MEAPKHWREAVKRIDPLYDIIWNPTRKVYLIVCSKHSESDPNGFRYISVPCGGGWFKMMPLHYVILELVDRRGRPRPLGPDILWLLRFWKNEEAVKADKARDHTKSKEDQEYIHKQDVRRDWRQIKKFQPGILDLGAR